MDPARRSRFPIHAFAAVLALAVGAGCGGSGSSASGPTIPAEVPAVLAAAAEAMGAVTSAEFTLQRGGAPIYIDQFSAIGLERLVGQFAAPRRAQALLTVTVNDNLTTELAAVAIDDEVWLSEPVTGKLQPLPPGYDIDPSKFFDPQGGWKPLLSNIAGAELVGTDERDEVETYHVRGTAPAEQVERITVGLVRDQDVPIELWIDTRSGLVAAASFTTVFDGASTTWDLAVAKYGEQFTIEPPP